MDSRSSLHTSTPSIRIPERASSTLLILACRHGAQNAYDGASKQTLENEFGTSNEDECMVKILEKGDIQETEVGLPHWKFQAVKSNLLFFRRQSVKDPRTTPWVLASLIKALDLHTLF